MHGWRERDTLCGGSPAPPSRIETMTSSLAAPSHAALDTVSMPGADLGPIGDDLADAGDRFTLAHLPSAHTENARAAVDAVLAGQELLTIRGYPSFEELAALRDALWPKCHVSAVYRVDTGGQVSTTARRREHVLDGSWSAKGRQAAGLSLTEAATVLYVRPRVEAMGQTSTRQKFDLNAVGWNGTPGSPTYRHYRWMRRLLAEIAQPCAGLTALDAGSGTGWVGLEAARMGAKVSAFDPSPAMVELAKENAKEIKVPLDARVGFVEDVPFDQRFELVLNSGVISFAPDADVYLDRLDAVVAPGGLLVIGDLNPKSRGFARRRARDPMLPARELNGLRRREVEERLVARGYTIEKRWYYQLTFPVPELMALAEKRDSHFACGAMLALNRAASAVDQLFGSVAETWFDSWILRARKGT